MLDIRRLSLVGVSGFSHAMNYAGPPRQLWKPGASRVPRSHVLFDIVLPWQALLARHGR